MKDQLFAGLQHLLPQHLISRLVGSLADSEIAWIKNALIQQFANFYAVNMAEALEEDPLRYRNFNDFFGRALKPEARPIAPAENALVSPVDGVISELGEITDNQLLQAKGKKYTLSALLGGDEQLTQTFANGRFCTIYLAPKDYHRIHMPFDGELQSMVHVPGRLFSVNPSTVNHVDNLFARNERVISVFSTAFGPLAVIMVGAIIVASIETVWAGEITPRRGQISRFHYGQSKTIALKRGEEMGRFKLGSTVILLLPPNSGQWAETCKAGRATCMGESIGEIVSP